VNGEGELHFTCYSFVDGFVLAGKRGEEGNLLGERKEEEGERSGDADDLLSFPPSLPFRQQRRKKRGRGFLREKEIEGSGAGMSSGLDSHYFEAYGERVGKEKGGNRGDSYSLIFCFPSAAQKKKGTKKKNEGEHRWLGRLT